MAKALKEKCNEWGCILMDLKGYNFIAESHYSSSEIPQNYVGDFFVKLRTPIGIRTPWIRMPIWGQVCDGDPRIKWVKSYFHSRLPFGGLGWKYFAWKTIPVRPDLCDRPTYGEVNERIVK